MDRNASGLTAVAILVLLIVVFWSKLKTVFASGSASGASTDAKTQALISQTAGLTNEEMQAISDTNYSSGSSAPTPFAVTTGPTLVQAGRAGTTVAESNAIVNTLASNSSGLTPDDYAEIGASSYNGVDVVTD